MSMLSLAKSMLRVATICCLAILFGSACQSSGGRTSNVSQTDQCNGNDEKAKSADHMTEDDTSRAEAALDEQKSDSERGSRPAVGRSRDGTRAVDQPRVGRP